MQYFFASIKTGAEGLGFEMSNAPVTRPNILIIDDEESVRNLLRQILSQDYLCQTAVSAEEALGLLETESYALVLCDINMPGMSGLRLIPLISALAPDTVVVMISGEQMIDTAIDSMRVGAFDYIKKPFEIEHIKTAVERALNHHSLLTDKRKYENHLEELVEIRTRELNYLSNYDALTRVPNRLLFEDRLEQALAAAQHNKRPLGVLAVSLDKLDKINDSLGRASGDRLLCETAKRFVKLVEDGDSVARFEGREFVFLLTAITEPQDLIASAEKIKAALQTPFWIDNQEIFLTASIGIGLFPEDGTDAHALLKNAGAAMHRAKERGDNYQFYTADINDKALQRLVMENNLRRALEREEFEVYYQPKVSVLSKQIVGMEALIRWHHPQQGLISPAEFIPLAEETGLIVPIGEWILRKACAQCREWQNSGSDFLSVSVNLSARQFEQPNLFEMVASILRETDFNPKCLELELTESSIMKNSDSAIKILKKLKKIGIKISIDDFGTGYSSLSYLIQLPIDVLKIDKSFIRKINVDKGNAAMAMAIVSMARNLQLKVIAEGVENEQQLQFLYLLGCDEWQGFFNSQPIPAVEFAKLLPQKNTGGDSSDS